MPERDMGRGAERALLAGSVICLVGAVAALTSGEVVVMPGGAFRTHTDAVWVLGVLAVVLFVAAYFVSDERKR